jgi:DNA repair exonuclease SbcCD ATPase subunit
MSDTPKITAFADYYEIKAERDQLKAEVERLKNKTPICQNCKEEVAFWALHIHSLPNQETSYYCFSSQQLKAELERQAKNNRLLLVQQEHEEQTREFLRCEVETLKAQVSELINQRNQLLPFQSEVARLKELHIMQLAAISVAANSNTDSTVDEPLKCHPDYKTVALSVVVVAVQREIWERKEKEKWHDMAREFNESVHCSEAAIEKTVARLNAMEGKV